MPDMPHPFHPDDELLAALAAGEPDAAGNASLTSHVAACDRCGPMVNELRQLRLALAELPDVAPSRPLQLIPPVPAPLPQPSGWTTWLRRVTAPAMTAAAVLILVGAIGSAVGSGLGAGGAAGEFSGAAASAGSASSEANQPVARPAGSGTQNDSLGRASASPTGVSGGSPGLNAFGPQHTASASPARSRSAESQPPAEGGQTSDRLLGRSSVPPAPLNPFPWMLGIGVALLAVAFLARGYVRRQESGGF
jgi:hypothetical protein